MEELVVPCYELTVAQYGLDVSHSHTKLDECYVNILLKNRRFPLKEKRMLICLASKKHSLGWSGCTLLWADCCTIRPRFQSLTEKSWWMLQWGSGTPLQNRRPPSSRIRESGILLPPGFIYGCQIATSAIMGIKLISDTLWHPLDLATVSQTFLQHSLGFSY